MKVDIRDAITFGGIGLMGYGCWQVEPALAFFAIGFSLFILGIIGR